MKSQATRASQKQLAYLAYWQDRGYTFGRDDVIPESTFILPPQWSLPSWIDLSFTLAALISIYVLLGVSHG